MHTYLKAIGFKQISNIKQENILLNNIIDNPQSKKLVANPYDRELLYAELTTEFMPGIGIKIIGQYDDNEKFHMEYYFPYVEGRFASVKEECYIGKKMDNTSYSGLCEDDRIGVSLIFHLINSVDYIANINEKMESDPKNVRISALCSDGIIMLPTIYSSQAAQDTEETLKHVKMVAEAKNGNTEAIEKLTLAEMNTYSQIGRRIADEDVFSIVETSLIPYGMEAEVYKILGIILEMKLHVNPILKEEVYQLKVKCNGVVFDIAVNKDDLAGEPMVGRRFRGIVWLQGVVEF